MLVRRVQGDSMLPVLHAGQYVLASSVYRELKPEQLVIIYHANLEKIKRLQEVKGDKIFVVGDNPQASTDSRAFGWLPRSTVQAKVIWPRV